MPSPDVPELLEISLLVLQFQLLNVICVCIFNLPARVLLEHGADTGIVSFEQELPLDVAQGKDMLALLKDWMQRQSVDEKAARSAEERQMLHDAQEWLRTGQYP